MGRCPRCHGRMALDPYERDGSLCCLSCGHVQHTERVKATWEFNVEHLEAVLKHRKHRPPPETPFDA